MTRLLSDSPRLRRGAASGGFLLALIAFVLALLTAGYIVYRDPPWGRLSKYDFSSPEASLRSQIKMEMNADILASVELASKLGRKEIKEKFDSLEIKADKTGEVDGKKVVFYQYKVTDKESKKTRDVKDVQWFEKDEDSGYWKRSYMDPATVQAKNEKLAKEIAAWSNRLGFGGPGD